MEDTIITTDVMGCQKDIVKLIRYNKADYMLTLKRNQGSLYVDVTEYFDDPALRAGCAYHKVVEKAHSALEIREYWQTNDIAWLHQRKDWAGLVSIVMTKNTTIRGRDTISDVRYFISSLPLNVAGAE